MHTEIMPQDEKSSHLGFRYMNPVFTPADGPPITFPMCRSTYLTEVDGATIAGIETADARAFEASKVGRVGSLEVTELEAKSGEPFVRHTLNRVAVVCRSRYGSTRAFAGGCVLFAELPPA